MEQNKRLDLLQMMYAAVLADTVLQFENEGVLQSVTDRKQQAQMATGKLRANQLGINAPEEVFAILSEIFNCARWTITPKDSGFAAGTTACTLCAIAKKMGSPSPCRIYCLDPMEGMIKGLDPQASFTATETLWESDRCNVEIKR